MNWLVHISIHAIVHVAWVLAGSIVYGQVCQLAGSDGGRGSAVCVGTFDYDGSAVFLTAGHCVPNRYVQDGGKIWLAPEGRWVVAQPLAWWSAGPGKDLAILRCAEFKPQSTYEIGKRSPAIGSEVELCGFAHAGRLTVQHTRIVGYKAGEALLECRGIQGVSGGPVLVGRSVVGILTHDCTDGRGYGIATNVETINQALSDWRVAPGQKQTAWVGLGVGGGCGPYGCYPRPIAPVMPVVPVQPYRQPYDEQPFGQPQQPGYPGFSSKPETPPVDLSEIKSSIERLELAITAIKATRPKDGEPGPQGPPGRDADTSEINARLGRLENAEIPVRILDADGKVIDERRYKLGEPLEFRLVPRTK